MTLGVGRRHLTGIVVSDRMTRTVVIRVTRLVSHPVYGRVTRRFKKFKADTGQHLPRLGDEVRVEESRPLSKDKRWRVVEVLRRGVGLVEDREAERVKELEAVGATRVKVHPKPAPAAADEPVKPSQEAAP
ncbi:MAG: 30S ribosomal protein S17 [Candidatus Omnitrophica bacterium]|nr:30S ribosomal protein S17 [Candidatus Omnitrophota bacterium]